MCNFSISPVASPAMISGFHERFNPQAIKNRDGKPYLDPSFVQKAAERSTFGKKEPSPR